MNTENPENKQNFEIKYLLNYKSKWKDLYMKNDQEKIIFPNFQLSTLLELILKRDQ